MHGYSNYFLIVIVDIISEFTYHTYHKLKVTLSINQRNIITEMPSNSTPWILQFILTEFIHISS